MTSASPASRPSLVAAAHLALVALLIAGCAGDRGSNEGVDASTSASAHRAPDQTTAITSVTTATTSAGQALAAGVCPEVGPVAAPDADRPVYRADITADPATGAVAGTLSVAFTPDLPIDRLVVRLWANAPRASQVGTVATIDQVNLDGEAVPPAEVDRPEPTTVIIRLGEERVAGERVDLSMDLTLEVGSGARDRLDRRGDAMRLGSFLPLLPWVPGVGWAEDPPTAIFAEATTSPIADYDVTLSVPAGYDVLATGVSTERSPGSRRWRAEAVRDFAASIGHFDLASATVDAPQPVEVTVGIDRSVDESARSYLDRVAAAMAAFSTRFGAYPWPALSVAVTPGLGGGIEMPMHIMQGPETLGRTTPHEVGHMWFYSLVGNNQGRDPWLDEGLASYAEATFEGSLDEFRAEPQTAATDRALGRPLTYWADHPDNYYRGVYVQGALALADLGSEAMIDCALRHFVAEHAYAIATPGDLVDALTFVFPDATTVLGSYGIAPGG